MNDEARYRAFDRWSARLLAVAALFAVVVTSIVLVSGGDVLAWLRIALAALQVPAVAALLITIQGLGWGKPWARPAAVALLAVIVVSGIVELVTALSRGTLHLPLLALAALVVLRRAPSGRLLFGTRPADRVVVATLVALFLVPLIGNSVLGWAAVPGRTALAVDGESLNPSVALDCGTGSAAPEEIRATFSWHWTERDLFPGGRDGVLLRWEFADPEVAGMRYFVAEVPGAGHRSTGRSATNEAGGEIWVGRSSPSDALLEDPIGEGYRALSLVVDVDRQSVRDDSIELILRPDDSAPPPRHAVLDFWGSYAHLDRWVRRTDVVTCHW